MIDGTLTIYKKDKDEYIIKNTGNGKYIKAGEKEVAYLLSFDENNTFADIDADRSKVNTLNDAEKKYLYDFFLKVKFIHSADDSDSSSDVKERKNIKKILENITVIRLAHFDPDKFLEKTKKLFNCFFTVPAFILLIVLMVAGESALLKQVENIDFDVLLKVDAKSMLFLVISILPTGIIHEFAHAIACKHYGGGVHKVGFLLFYFMPAFYADVSDIYIVKRKKHKLIICLAGIASNLVLANVSLLAFTALNAKGISIKFLFYYYILNLGTAVYNLFPYVKMDGYWVMQSFLNESNLMDKAKTMFYMSIYCHKNYKSLVNLEKKKKMTYLICGLLMIISSLFFWGFGLDAIYGMVQRNINLLAAQIISFLMLILIIISLVLQHRTYCKAARDNKFNWR